MGLTEIAKPAMLAARGGAWFRGEGELEVHVGVEPGFRPAAKAHPAILLDGVVALDVLVDRLATLGYVVDRTEQATFPGFIRAHVRDAHGNRIELLAESA